ncbi:cell wall-binding repeat-containing protein [Planococcus sp. SSTMD024]|uniref:cell wall-binding repeat-containing protein n=1 Tax=Planococcus sp. SSTMD024 TaxID=3242163 RepID=UPI00351E4304
MTILKKISFLHVFLIIFLVLTAVWFSDVSSAEEEVSVTSFGATGEGEVDETVYIQKAINFISDKGGGTVNVPKGTYLIDAIKSIVLKDNISLKFEEGTILKALPNKSQWYEVIEIHDVKNVNISGFVEIIGDRKEHYGTSGEWGFGISIKGSDNITVENVKISDCWGDGIYVGSTLNQNYNKNVNIVNPILDNNRRQGISIISAINLNIYNAKITNTNGTPPESGIDIEPNSQNEKIQNVNIYNLSTSNNKGRGLEIILKNLRNSNEPVSITVDTIKKLADGYQIKHIEGVKGNINVAGYDYLKDKPKEVKRISGNNRYYTSIKISQEGWNDADTVVLATGSDFPDALAGGPLAYQEDAPILLTRTKSLNTETKQEIKRLGAKKVMILGGNTAVSMEVEAELESMGLSTERLGGKTRFETAALIAGKIDSNRAVVANGLNFPDVLSISSYAAKNGVPILLTRTDRIPDETRSALKGVSSTYVIGSTSVVSKSVYDDLPKPTRYGGKDRYETGYEVSTKLQLGTDKAFIATGSNFPDALAGSVLAAKNDAPILLVRPEAIPDATKNQLSIYNGFSIFGGTGAVSDEVKNLLDEALKK